MIRLASSVQAFQWTTSAQLYPFEVADDGSTLYAKKFTTTGFTGSMVQIPHGMINETKAHRMWFSSRQSTNYYITGPNEEGPNGNWAINVDLYNGNIRIYEADGGNNRTASDVTVYLLYKL